MVFLRTPAQTHNNALKRSAFLRSREREKEVSHSLSLSLFCSCRCCCCSNASRVVRFESEEEGEKKNDSEKIFLRAREKTQNILQNSFRFFPSLSRSRSLRSSSSSSRATTPRERERERCAHLFKNAPRLSFRETYLCVLSLCSSFCSEYFYSFSSCREKWIKKSGLCGRFRFFDGIF